jgi:hypothetical protein
MAMHKEYYKGKGGGFLGPGHGEFVFALGMSVH